MIRACIPFIFLALICNPARSQGVISQSFNSKKPLKIYANNGIEWRQNDRIFIARGDARAVRDHFELRADRLRALYIVEPNNDVRITQINANGKVHISTPDETAVGETGVYDLEKSIMVLSGGKVQLETKTDTITADGQLEYWEGKQMAVARDNAVVIREGRRLRADVLVAYFQPVKGNKKNRIDYIEAFDNVQINIDKDVITAKHGVYKLRSSIITLSGDVKLIREEEQLSGCTATINLKTNVRQLKSCRDKGKKVKGILKQNTKKLPFK